MTPPPLPRLLSRYADAFHGAVLAGGGGHHIASPTGAWLLLALLGPTAQGEARAQLEEVLGADVATSAGHAAAMLRDPHPAVTAAAAVWLSDLVRTPAVAAWAAALPATVEQGPVPSQDAADAWAQDRTGGLIRQFPAQLDHETMLVLATALASRISWTTPFDVSPATELGGPWARQVSTVLRSAADHRTFIAATRDAGQVAVHVARSADDLSVVSVIAAPEVPAAAVLATAHELAHELAAAEVTWSVPRGQRSLFELPLGDGPAWTLTERMVECLGAERVERSVALLPAWSASSGHDLLSDPGFGFGPAAQALLALAGSQDGDEVQAQQAATAAYSREGFQAAAVTFAGVWARGWDPTDGVLREATLRFAHPYAVVAVASDVRRDGLSGHQVPGLWHGVPVFSGWVETPVEVSTE